MKMTSGRSFAITIALAGLSCAITAVGCDGSVDLDIAGILAGQSGASCTNATPEAGADAGGCEPGFHCFNTYCVQEGAMRVSLTFDTDSDFDLHVKTPSGEEVWWDNRTAGSGKLDVDQCVSSCGTGKHVENVFFTTAAAQGDYTFFVQNYKARSEGTFTIEVAANGQKKEYRGSVPKTSKANSETFVYTYPPPALAEDAGTPDAAELDASDAGSD